VRSRWIDQAARWTVAIGALDTLVATGQVGRSVAAVERRAWARSSFAAIVSTGMPQPDMSVFGEEFANEYERWAGEVARAIDRE
jgi:hypothetical protein